MILQRLEERGYTQSPIEDGFWCHYFALKKDIGIKEYDGSEIGVSVEYKIPYRNRDELFGREVPSELEVFVASKLRLHNSFLIRICEGEIYENEAIENFDRQIELIIKSIIKNQNNTR